MAILAMWTTLVSALIPVGILRAELPTIERLRLPPCTPALLRAPLVMRMWYQLGAWRVLAIK